LAGTDSQEGVDRALEYLSDRAKIDEPYLVALIARAAQEAGDNEVAGEMLEQLRKLVRREGGLYYWNLESNTPFYGWGLAGRLERLRLPCVRSPPAGRIPTTTYREWSSLPAPEERSLWRVVVDSGYGEGPRGDPGGQRPGKLWRLRTR